MVFALAARSGSPPSRCSCSFSGGRSGSIVRTCAVGLDGRFAVLLQEFHAHARDFDIYGCAFAICLLLIPARSIRLRAAGSAVLGCPDPDPPHQLLMYVPTIRPSCAALLSGARHHPAKRDFLGSPRSQRFGILTSPRSSWHHAGAARRVFPHLQSRWPTSRNQPAEFFSYIWYKPLAKEIRTPGRACRLIC